MNKYIKNKITFVILGSVGTLGHISLASDIARIARYCEMDISVSLIIEECTIPPAFGQYFDEVTLIRPRLQRCSRGGRLNEPYLGHEIDQAIRHYKDSVFLFSTFFDTNIIKLIRQLGAFCGLITYPFRTSKFQLFLYEGFDRLFDDIVILDDIISPIESSELANIRTNVFLLPPSIYGYNDYSISKQRGASNLPLTVLTGCGGGLINGSDVIFRQMLEAIASFDSRDIRLAIMPGLNNKQDCLKETFSKTVFREFDELSIDGGIDLFIGQSGYYTIHKLLFYSIPSIIVPAPRLIDDQELRAIMLAQLTDCKVLLPSEMDRIKDVISHCIYAYSQWHHNVRHRVTRLVQQKKWASNGLEKWKGYLQRLSTQ